MLLGLSAALGAATLPVRYLEHLAPLPEEGVVVQDVPQLESDLPGLELLQLLLDVVAALDLSVVDVELELSFGLLH